MTETIKAALLALESPGSFAVRLSAPADALQLSVTKVGAVDFPVTPATAKRLLAVASRSPFGRREQTLIDATVRSGWEVAKSRIKVDRRRWNPVLRDILDSLHEQLGTPGRLSARLDKLTIYGPGEFFKAHQDTEKSADMIGTLVVLLPSRFSGGSLRVDRQGEKLEFRRTAKAAAELEILGFYADCHHEVRPIKSGHRIALVYQLCAELDAAGAELDILPDQLETLEHAITSHFETPQPVRYARDGRTFTPEKLVYLLDHQYTPQSLAWTKLKHADALRAAALREVAGALELDIYLALVDVHEIWQCAPRFTRRRWSRWGDEDDDDDDDDDDYELLDLVDSDVVLRHCQDASGKRVTVEKLHIEDAELCFTTANDDLHPFESEYEGYMGNYGDTLDRWYHRAAIVVWPKTNAFIVKARLNPRAAVKQLFNELNKPSTRTAARDRLRRLLDVWPSCIGREPSAQLLLEALQLAVVVDDESVAETLLEPMRPEVLTEAAIQPLLALVVCYGMDWCQRLLDAWHQRPWSAQPWQKAYSRGWLAKLVSEDAELGLELAHFIAAKQWDEVRTRLSSLRPARLRSPYSTQNSQGVIAAVADVLHSSMIVDAPALRDSVITMLVSEDAPLAAIELAGLVDRARDAWGVEQIAKHCRGQLVAELAKPARAVGDWSIVIPRTCKCGDCATLHEFLESNEVHLSWPLAKGRRAHIHGAIDSKGLPVTHTTKRTGSPHKLELTKTKQLAAVETKLRRAREKALARLRAA